MYEVKRVELRANLARSHDRPTDAATGHRSLGHVGIPRILRMANRNLVDGLNITTKSMIGMCKAYLYGKAMHRPFDEEVTHKTDVFERVYIDLWGPVQTQSQGGAKYLMICSDGRLSVKIPCFLQDK